MGMTLSSSASQIHLLGCTSFPSPTTLSKSTSRNVVFFRQRLYSNGISLSKSSLVRVVTEKAIDIGEKPDLVAVTEKVAGIDFGATNSEVAEEGKDGKPAIITDIEGKRRTPSVAKTPSSLLNIRSKKRTRRTFGLKGINIPTKIVPFGGGENASRPRRGRRSQSSVNQKALIVAVASNLQNDGDGSKSVIPKNVMGKSKMAGAVRPTTPPRIAKGNLPVSNST